MIQKTIFTDDGAIINGIITTEEELRKLYIEENKTYKEMCSFFNGIHVSQLIHIFKHFGITKDQKLVEKNRQKNLLDKYGVSNVSMLETVKKAKEDMSVKKYGVTNVSKAESIKDLKKKTFQERYGTDCFFQTQDFKNGMLDKYGVPFHPITDDEKQKIIDTNLQKYGVMWSCQRPECRFHGKDSKPNLGFAELLSRNNIDFTRELPLENYSYDFHVGNYLIEIDPSGTHNSTFGLHGNKPKEHNYHKIKSDIANKHGYKCIHIFDWDDSEKVINRFLPKQDISAEECDIKEVSKDEARDFLNMYHPQDYTNSKISYGLYLDNTLVEIISFTKPRYNKDCEWEISRVCAKPGFHIIGGMKRIFDYFVKEYNPKSIVVYCDMSKMDGSIYTNLGFTLNKKPHPSRHWFNLKTKQHITDAFLWTKGFDRLFGTSFGKTASNTELMKQAGFVEVYDCGQATYIWCADKIK